VATKKEKERAAKLADLERRFSFVVSILQTAGQDPTTYSDEELYQMEVDHILRIRSRLKWWWRDRSASKIFGQIESKVAAVGTITLEVARVR